ncbi:MAG: hypothetical protein IT204_14165 [Fimbriimonadaceae bacterium]|nr:hypothetical protein [Fimbriimonadaceae bacterium]
MLGVSRAEAGLDLAAMGLFGGGPFRLAWFDYLAADPWRGPVAAEQQGRGWLAQDGLAPALARAGTLAGYGVRRGLVGSVPDSWRQQLHSQRPLAAALARLRQAGGGVPPGDDPPTEDLPLDLQNDLALLLLAAEGCLIWRERLFADVPGTGLAAHLADLQRFAAVDDDQAPGAESLAHEARLDRLTAALDLAALHAGGMDLALVLDDVRGRLAARDWTAVAPRRWATGLGDVVIGSNGDDTWEGESPLLLLDPAGNDTYHTGAAVDQPQRPVALLLDLAGNDRYEASAAVAQGAALGGWAYLLDLAGDDQYLATDLAQGCGIAGIGLLYDAAGRDRYTARAHAQGAAAFGLGLLLDRGGDDQYTAFHRVQGYGYTRGCGALVDWDGADRYLADDTTIAFPSPQSAQHNTSLAQGFGFGRRADYTTGASLAGGTGWLVDGAGADQYRCGVFGQGGGYWYGLGVLSDFGGDDTYEGAWYVQAAAAHFAIGLLLDTAGADRYTATLNMAQGAGHDFSVGFLQDEAGNDRYQAPNLALGAGNANGVGYLLERAGDDVYEAKDGVNLGMARTPGTAAELALSVRRDARSLGLFVDAAGRDGYPRPTCADGRTWRDQQPGTAAQGVGTDLP